MVEQRSSAFSMGDIPDPVEKDGLCLLSLDGGGVRGLSTLHILQRIMDRVNDLRKERGRPFRLPCEIFDMIGGTSTGGLIAIMLGRLRMSVKDCINVYEKLMVEIFGRKAHWPISLPLTIQARYDPQKIKTEIENLLSEYGFPKDSLFTEEEPNNEEKRRCRVSVSIVVLLAQETGNQVILRSYKNDLHDQVSATISQAARATSAASSYFPPVTISGLQYVDGATRNNNPIMAVEADANSVWASEQIGLDSLIKCFVTIGTGVPAKEAVPNTLSGMFSYSLSVATDTQAVHQSFQDRRLHQWNERRLFRFNVTKGLEKVELDDHEKRAIIERETRGYMEEADQRARLVACTQNLMEKECKYGPQLLPTICDLVNYKLRIRQGSYNHKELHDCRAVLQITDVEKDRNDLEGDSGPRVPGTLEWITTNTCYQTWLSTDPSAPNALWIKAGVGRGKTVLSLFVLKNLEARIEKSSQRADLYYFFCSSEHGHRQNAVGVFRSLIYQIVNKHEHLMKYVLDYLENNRPSHLINRAENGNETQLNNQQLYQRSSSATIQNDVENKLPTQANFIKNFIRSPITTKEEENKTRIHSNNQVGDSMRSNEQSTFLQNMRLKSRKDEGLEERPEKRQQTQEECGSTESLDSTGRESSKSRQLELLDVTELSFILRRLIQEVAVETIYFLLDGVNECAETEQEALTTMIPRLLDVEPGKFKMLVSSRHIGGLGTFPNIKIIELEETEQTKGDVEKFISQRVKTLANVPGFKEIQGQVEEDLLRLAEGTFLSVSLVMRDIKQKKTCTDILNAIRSFPPRLDGKYRHMIDQIDPAHQETVYRILRWVIAAIQPMTLQELAAVINVPPRNIQEVRDAVTWSEGLLEVHGTRVTFVNTSAKEFLLNYGTLGQTQEEMHYQIAESCYHDIRQSGLSRSAIKLSELLDEEDPRLLKYAIRYWMDHVRASKDWAEKNFDPDSDFLRKDSKLRKNWWTTYLRDVQNSDPNDFNVTSLLHLSAYFGVDAWMKRVFEGQAWIMKQGTMLMELDHFYRTPLHIAVEQGHDIIVFLLLREGVDIEFREASLFATPLHLAARNGHRKICEILVDHKAKIDARNRFYSTPLTEAARGGHMEVVRFLVRKNADINGSIDKGPRSLYRRIEKLPGSAERAFGRINSAEYAERSTPLIEAARKNHTEIIRHLKHCGANLEATNMTGFNALRIAAYHGHSESMEALIGLGAHIEGKDDSGRTALFVASWQNRAAAIQSLVNHDVNTDSSTNSGSTPLLVASRNGFIGPMKILLKAQAKLEHQDANGASPLAVASKFGKVSAVELLLNHGAKVNAQDQWGGTPLMMAIQDNLTDDIFEVVQLLLNHGADIDHKNQKGITPLMQAVQVSDGDAASIVELLLEKGAMLSPKDTEGRTALMHASKGSSNTIRETLLRRGAAVDTKDHLGDTALIIAAGYSDPSAVSFLLDQGADIEARDDFGFTPLMKAAKCGYEDTASLLLNRGANIAVLDNERKSAIDHAATRKRGNIVKLLRSKGASSQALTLLDYAAESLSSVMHWTVKDCRGWERDWELDALKELRMKAVQENKKNGSSREQVPQDPSKNVSEKIESDSEAVELNQLDADGPYISKDEYVPHETQDAGHPKSSDEAPQPNGTDLNEDSELEDQKEKSAQSTSGLAEDENRDLIDI
ncbi:hypothetical protein ACLMJK_009292 [Lecanora helva]